MNSVEEVRRRPVPLQGRFQAGAHQERQGQTLLDRCDILKAFHLISLLEIVCCFFAQNCLPPPPCTWSPAAAPSPPRASPRRWGWTPQSGSSVSVREVRKWKCDQLRCVCTIVWGFLFRKPASQAQMVDTAEGGGRGGEAERGGGEHGGLCSRRLIDFFLAKSRQIFD